MSTPSDQTPSEPDAPLSRREMREAAARAGDVAPAEAGERDTPAAPQPDGGFGWFSGEVPVSDASDAPSGGGDDGAPVEAPEVPAPRSSRSAVEHTAAADASVPVLPVREGRPDDDLVGDAVVDDHGFAPRGAADRSPASDEPVPAPAAHSGGFDSLLGTPADSDAAPRTRRDLGDERVTTGSLTSINALFDEDHAAPPPKPKKPKRRGGCLIGVLVMLVVLALMGAGVAFAWNTFGEQIQGIFGPSEPADFEAGLKGEEVMVTIKDGETGGDISQSLFDAGVTKTPDAFYDHLVSTGSATEFFPGLYKLRTRLPSAEAEKMLTDPANKVENTALITEGETAAQAYETLATVLKVPVADVQAAAADPKAFGVNDTSLEGWLFPATYEFEAGTTPHDAIQTLVDRMKQALTDNGVAPADQHRILTVASIIQREARYDDDFYKVSRVIENRLAPDNTETHGLLQMDSTVQYGAGQLASGSVSTSEEARDSDNPYNTYMHPGLPAGPISLPGDLAIKAAIAPAEGPWFYFVTVNLETGETVFSTTSAEHEAAVTKWHDWCDANPDSGC